MFIILPFSQFETNEMKRTQESSFIDTCYIQDKTTVTTPSGAIEETWTDRETETPCRFDAQGTQLRLFQGVELQTIEAQIIVPFETDIDKNNKVKITKIANESVGPYTFDVDGIPKPGRFGIIVELRTTQE